MEWCTGLGSFVRYSILAAALLMHVPATAQCFLSAIEEPSGGLGNFFGQVLDLRDDLLAVGEPSFVGGIGRAWVFRDDGEDWMLEGELIAPDVVASDYYGYSVAIDGEFAVVGAPGEHDCLHSQPKCKTREA